MSEHERYVSNAGWVHQSGRPDAIDEVADQFERPAATAEPALAAGYAAVAEAGPRWPRTARGGRALELMHSRTASNALSR